MIHSKRACLAVLVLVFVSVWCDDEHVHHMDHRGPNVPHGDGGEHNDDYDHQAILGSEELDNEFGDMPEEEARMRLEKMVVDHDLDKNGIITKDEMTLWITDSFKKLDREEALEKFLEEDHNQDGKVSWTEYLEKVYSFSPDDVKEMHKTAGDQNDKTEEGREALSNLKMVSDDDDFFKAADKSKDGNLDKEEYLAFFFPPNYEHMHQVEMDHFMRDKDTDKDGKLSKDEFMPEQADQEAQSHGESFMSLDANRDGFLTPEEAKEWVVPKTDEMIEDEVKHLITMADTDNDGKLTMKEILDKSKEFVGSSITDYGNFMHDEL